MVQRSSAASVSDHRSHNVSNRSRAACGSPACSTATACMISSKQRPLLEKVQARKWTRSCSASPNDAVGWSANDDASSVYLQPCDVWPSDASPGDALTDDVQPSDAKCD